MLLQLVDMDIVLNDLVAEIGVAADESLDGVLQLEFGETEQIFTNPAREQTQQYITGRFG